MGKKKAKHMVKTQDLPEPSARSLFFREKQSIIIYINS